MNNIQENFRKKLGKFVSLTVEEKGYGLVNKVNYEGVILPKFCPESDSFISESDYIICNLISGEKINFKKEDVIDLKTKKCSKEIKDIIANIYKLSKEKIKIESNKYLIKQKEEENKKKFMESINKIKEIEGAMTFWDFRGKIEELLLKEIRGCKLIKDDYGYTSLTIDDYKVSMFGGEDDDYEGLFLIKLDKKIYIEKYAHVSGYSFIHGGDSCYDTCNIYIDIEDNNYKSMLEKYKNDNKIVNATSLKAIVDEKSYFSIEDKGWLSYTHKIDIVLKETLLPREKNINKVVEIFKNN